MINSKCLQTNSTPRACLVVAFIGGDDVGFPVHFHGLNGIGLAEGLEASIPRTNADVPKLQEQTAFFLIYIFLHLARFTLIYINLESFLSFSAFESKAAGKAMQSLSALWLVPRGVV